MIRLHHLLGTALLGLCALGVLGGLPAAANAAGIGFRNDLNVRVIVQGASYLNNVVRRGQPLVIDPGKTLWDTNLPVGDRVIIIYSAQLPNRILHREVVPFQGQDLMLYVQPAMGGRVRISEHPSP
jgi:hypothetical protein